MRTSYPFQKQQPSQLAALFTGLLMLLSLSSGCGSSPSLSKLQLDAPSSLAAGLSGQVTAAATYSDGTIKDVSTLVTWVSDAPTIVTVSDAAGSKGTIKAVSIGAAHISGSLDGQSAQFTVQVSAAEVATLSVSPVDPTLPKGTTVQLVATGTYTDGSQKDVTSQVVWNATAPSLVFVSSDVSSAGLVTAMGEGTGAVMAVLGKLTATVQITVIAPQLSSIAATTTAASIQVGDTLQLVATGTYSDGSTQDLSDSVIWDSSDASLLNISNEDGSRGQASAKGTGTVTVSATMGGVVSTLQLVIN